MTIEPYKFENGTPLIVDEHVTLPIPAPSVAPSLRVLDLSNNVFSQLIYVLVGNFTDARREIEARFGIALDADEDEPFGESWSFHSTKLGRRVFVSLIPSLETDPLTLSIVAHEALHVVFNVLQFVGIKLVDPSEEAFCYFLDWIVKEIYSHGKK